jgi:rhamnosyltransferase
MVALAGVVVLYNPPEDVFCNIQTYLLDLQILYVIDNSDTINTRLISRIKEEEKAVYISNQGNLGLAKALNMGAEFAIADGFQWLMTLDQDSRATKEMVSNMLDYILNCDSDQAAIVSPFHTDIKTQQAPKDGFEKCLTVMTSGNLVNLNIFQKVGPFLEKLFIDNIDDEYCLRVRKKGYQVIRVNSAILKHQLGNQSLYAWGIIVTHHNVFRRYYITRNRLYIFRKYKEAFPEYCRFLVKENLKDLVKILLFEKEKIKKIKSMFFGYLDSRKL